MNHSGTTLDSHSMANHSGTTLDSHSMANHSGTTLDSHSMANQVRIRSGMDDYRLSIASNVMNCGQLLNLLSYSQQIPVYPSTRMWIGGSYIPRDTILMFSDDYVIILGNEWGSASINGHEMPALQFTKIMDPVVTLD